jgi:3-hydroxybutyryl-CoA dehydrogenase
VDFERAGVIGAGTMGTGIAYVLAWSGASVWLVEPDDAQADRAWATLAGRAAKARLRDGAGGHLDALLERIHRLTDIDGLPLGLDVIVEAVPERVDIKVAVLAAAQLRKPRLLGTNTSALSIDLLASELPEPTSLVGLHFFNPVWAMRLLEVVRGPQTPDPTIDQALLLAAQLAKEPIVVADSPGFATSRLGLALGLEAMRMLEDHVAAAADIDKAMELGYRHPMGPLRLSDLVGLDVRLEIARVLQRAHGERFAPPRILVEMVQRGELGQKSGQGFYRWPPSAQLDEQRRSDA